jgi:hypothetical protein
MMHDPDQIMMDRHWLMVFFDLAKRSFKEVSGMKLPRTARRSDQSEGSKTGFEIGIFTENNLLYDVQMLR